MASIEPSDLDNDGFPQRPTTPPVRRGFLTALFWLALLALLVNGIPYIAEQTGYSWEVGRARAAAETLAKLDKAGVINRSSELFRLANTAVSPSVVNIRTIRAEQAADRFHRGNAGKRPFFPQVTGLGSGVVIDKDRGYIVTNNHVVKDAQEIMVRIGGRRELEASLVGADPKSDLAVLKINGTLKAQAEWGDSDKLAIGDWVMAIGSPFALDHTVTAGIVSATGRTNVALPDQGEDGYQDFIQTDAAINPGNSGGPLVDLNGKVVGINTAIYSETGGYQGIGLAIPSSMAKRIVEQLIANGKVSRGYLGVSIREVGLADSKQLQNNELRGAVVMGVQPGGPADQAGLLEDDIVVKLGDKTIDDVSSLRNSTAALPLGSKVDLTYLRKGRAKQTQVTIGELPAFDVEKILGFEVHEVPPGAAKEGAGRDLDGPYVAVEKVVSGGPADRAGLRPGMIILGVALRPIRTKSDFVEASSRINPTIQSLFLQIRTLEGALVGLVVPPQK